MIGKFFYSGVVAEGVVVNTIPEMIRRSIEAVIRSGQASGKSQLLVRFKNGHEVSLDIENGSCDWKTFLAKCAMVYDL